MKTGDLNKVLFAFASARETVRGAGPR